MSFPAPPCEIGHIPDARAVRALAPALAAAAQAVYDAWDQDIDGNDDVYGAGGICDTIASAFLPVLSEAGIESLATVQASCGENHIFVVALLEGGAYAVDIAPGTYETGSGYVWSKRPGIVISPDDVSIELIGGPMTVEEFETNFVD